MENLHKDSLLREIYQDVAICLGGIFAVHKGLIADDLIWEIARSLERLYRKHQSRFAETETLKPEDELAPHPALVNLLERIKETA